MDLTPCKRQNFHSHFNIEIAIPIDASKDNIGRPLIIIDLLMQTINLKFHHHNINSK